MVNHNKRRGDQFERDVLALARTRGFPFAERTRPGRREDQGDIWLAPGLILQVKDQKTPVWRDWLSELESQRLEARADHGILVVKRRGTGGRPPLNLAVMPLDSMLRLLCESGWGDPDSITITTAEEAQ